MVVVGESKELLYSLAIQHNVKCIKAIKVADATKLASSLAKNGDTVLLSPACASWDQYKCFEDRGDEFITMFEKISSEDELCMNEKNKKLLSKINKDKRKSSLEKIKKKKRRELSLIVLLFLTVILGVGFMFSSYVKLKTINVSGENQITKDEILAAGNINSNLKTWTIKDDEVRNNIKNKYSIFKEVTVKSTFPSKIDIKVEEYRFIAKNKKTDGQIEIIMENGRTYSGQVRNNYNLPILENFKEDEEKLKEVYKNLLELKQEILIQISEIISEDDGNLTIYMNDGQKIKVSRANFAQKLNYYDEISKYIDDKKNTTLNLINGAYLETSKSEKQRIQNIKNLLAKNSVDTSNDKEKTTSESQNKEDNSSSDKNTTQNRAINSQNNNQASTQANKRKNT